MTCTKCNRAILPKEKYHRTKKGPHHFECHAKAKAAVVKMLIDSIQREKFLVQLSDEAIIAEFINRILGRINIDSFDYDLCDEFIARFKKLRWPGLTKVEKEKISKLAPPLPEIKEGKDE